MTGPFAAHPGTHAVRRAPLFRLSLRLPWRKPAVPETSLLSGTAAPRFGCCVCCVTEDANECEPRDSHLAPCSEGCNDFCAVAPHRPSPVPTFTPVPAREIGAYARRLPPRAENAAAAGGAPGAERAWSSPSAPGVAHADAMHAAASRYLPPRPVNGRSLGTQPRRHPELYRQWAGNPGADVLRRVLAGLRNLPPRQAVYGEKPVAEVLEAERLSGLMQP